MINRAFQFDLNSGDWVECTDEKFINEDIENFPHVLVVRYFNYDNYVYCPKHHSIENIFDSVDAGDSEIISDAGCKFQDSDKLIDKNLLYCPIHKQLEEIILIDGNEIITDTFCKFNSLIGFGNYCSSAIPFRWRIFQSDDKNFVNIAADVARLRGRSFNMVKHWDNFFISISVTEKKYLLNWAEPYQGVKIPQIVEDAAIEILRESTKTYYGLKPTVTANFAGLEKIRTYIRRPFDLNITLLEYFFFDFGDFDKVFPYECKDNYKIICRMLEINPPKSLRKAYAKNPYAIIWYMIFNQFGVKDVNFMQKFFLLDKCIADMHLDKFRFHKRNKEVISRINTWSAFNHFCKCLLKARGEKFMMNWLYKFSTTEHLNQNQLDTIKMFFEYEKNISYELKTKIFKNGLTWYVHDAISAEVSNYLQERDNVKIFYDEKVLNCEGNINGYNFDVVKETKILTHVGLELANCVASYKDRVLDLRSIIFVVSKNNRLCACIEVHEGKIVQARGYHNQDLTGEIEKTVQEWKNSKDITQMKDTTAEILGNEGRQTISVPKAVHIKRHEGDMITQEEIDALLAGVPIEYD